MKKFFAIAVLALTVTVSANAQTNLWDALFGSGGSATATALQDLLSGLGGQTIYTAPISLNGAYSYAGSAISVSKSSGSNDILSSLAGSTINATLENKVDGVLAKVGIQPGSVTFNFNRDDETFIMTVAGIPLPGTYKVGDLEQTVTLTFGKTMSYITLTGDLQVTATGATRLFPAKRTAAFLKKLAAKLGEGKGTTATIAQFAKDFDTYKIGFKLVK